MAETEDLITWDRFSAASHPLEMELRLARVWHVRAGPAYDVLRGTEPLSGRVIRTWQGKGTLTMTDDRTIPANAGTVLYVPFQEIRRYRCSGELWYFWWFECDWPGGAALAYEPVRAPQEPDEAGLCRQLWQALPHPAPQRRTEALGIFAHLLSRWFSGRTTPAEESSRIEDRIARVLAEIPNRLGPAPWSITAMADFAGMSQRAFREHFRRITGQSPKTYYDQKRLQLAAHLLRTSGVTLENLAEQLGYSSPFHLSKAFKSYYGQSPRAWRETTG